MTDQTTSKTAPTDNATHSPREADARIPITVKGQKYVSPAGRHSQQTHRMAEERATATGNSSEKEQHAHDRSAFVAEMDRIAEQKARNGQKKQGV